MPAGAHAGSRCEGGGMRHLLRRAIRDFVNLGERHFALFYERLKSSFVALVLTCISQKTDTHSSMRTHRSKPTASSTSCNRAATELQLVV